MTALAFVVIVIAVVDSYRKYLKYFVNADSWHAGIKIRIHVYFKRMTMPKKDMECFVVKFVESNGKKTEYAVKAYEVRH